MSEKPAVAKKPYRKMTLTDQVLVIRASDNNPELSPRQLAKQFGLDERTIRRALKYRDIQPLDLLKAAQSRAVSGWVKSVPIAAQKGDHRPSRDLLLYSGGIEPLKNSQGATVTIVFGSTVIPGKLDWSAQRDSVLEIASNSEPPAKIDSTVSTDEPPKTS